MMTGGFASHQRTFSSPFSPWVLLDVVPFMFDYCILVFLLAIFPKTLSYLS